MSPSGEGILDAMAANSLEAGEVAPEPARRGCFRGWDAAAAEALALPPPPGSEPGDRDSVALYLRGFLDILSGVPAGASRDAVLRWLRGALVAQSRGDQLSPRYKMCAFWLIAGWRPWPDIRNLAEPGFAALKAFAAAELDKLCAAQERDVYAALGLGAKLGGLGLGLDAHPRQDTHAGLAPPPGFDRDDRDGNKYLFMLAVAAATLDPRIQQTYREILLSVDLAAGEGLKLVKVKGIQRMFAKKATDHADADAPLAAENADTNRTAWVLPPDMLKAAYAAAAERLGDPTRVKNGYASDFDVATTKGYRALLANHVYDAGVTWGELAAEIRAAASQVRQSFVGMSRATGFPEDRLVGALDNLDAAVAALLHPSTASKPARLVVEIQYMTPEYLAMRKRTHAWYKIARAENAYGLMQDFQGGLHDD